MERQSDHKIKTLNTYGEGEYVSNDFGKFCDHEGIVHEVVPPYTPQQNGVIERNNRSIMNLVRRILNGKILPKELWGEKVSTTAYLLNICLRKKLKNITPEEYWSGFYPSLSHLEVFDLVAYRHVPDQLKKKLDDKGEKMILVRYHPTNGYKIYDTISKRILISRDMIFF